MEEFTFEPIRDKYTEDIKNNSIASRTSNPELAIHPSGCVLTYNFKNNFSKVRDFEVFPDDVWIVTYPKCGTTWTQEMVWLLKNNLDFETAKSTHLRERSPFLELALIMSEDEGKLSEIPDTIKLAAQAKRPRCIKSHLPVELLPKALWTVKPKIVHVSRDPRDVAISYYHHYRIWNGYQGSLENFTEAFLADRIIYSPFWSHLLGFWNLTDHHNHLLLNTFEDMKKDLPGVIRKTAKFLDVEVTDQQVEKLGEHLSFKSMKNNNKVNYLDLVNEVKDELKTKDNDLTFIRKGESGGWRNIYSTVMLEKFKKWTTAALTGSPYKEHPYSSI
ncbi:hypothetical protein RUM44_006856 [Polyplax serrata]|uniref:Sulfotransferase domain-containing protein n=1 Tax=Polyplax serrata TaxID=468196 RepID=A0ABR1AK10_POLSC